MTREVSILEVYDGEVSILEVYVDRGEYTRSVCREW